MIKGQRPLILSFDNGFEIDRMTFMSIGDVGIINGQNISYRGGQLHVDKADTITVKDGILSEVTNFEGNAIEFDVDEVKNIVNKCVNVEDKDFGS